MFSSKPHLIAKGTASERSKVIRTHQFLTLLTWKCASRYDSVPFFDISTFKSGPNCGALGFFACKRASRHNGVQFFIFHLASCLALAALASLLFDPPEPQIIGKNSESRLSYLFAHLHLLSSYFFSSLIFSLLFFSSLTLPTLLFHLSILSEV